MNMLMDRTCGAVCPACRQKYPSHDTDRTNPTACSIRGTFLLGKLFSARDGQYYMPTQIIVSSVGYKRDYSSKMRLATGWTAEVSEFESRYKIFLLSTSLCLTNYALRHEDIRGSECTDPRILNFGTVWRWVVSFTPRSLYTRGTSPPYPLDRRLVGTQNLPGKGENPAHTRTRTPTPRSSSLLPVAIQTALTRNPRWHIRKWLGR
jgi:hypothetical protein